MLERFNPSVSDTIVRKCARVYFLIKLQARSAALFKKRIVNIAKFLRTLFSQNVSGRLLLICRKISEAHLELCQTSKMELIYFSKKPHLRCLTEFSECTVVFPTAN